MQRKTSQREAIQEVFIEKNRPLGIEDILTHGRAIVASLNQATVYRNLKILVENGWLTQFNHPTLGSLYERTGKEHHHHFYCHVCKQVYELPGCPLAKGDIAPKGFVIEDHEVFLSGICPDCA
jgi:Fur family ferric uptake transcriptional regulator